MSDTWKREFHSAKARCVTLVDQLEDHDAVWALSAQYLYFPGLLRAAFELFPQPRGRLLMQDLLCGKSISLALEGAGSVALRYGGDAVGTDPSGTTLAATCFHWLQAHDRPVDILLLGEHCEPKKLLFDFLQVRVPFFHYSLF